MKINGKTYSSRSEAIRQLCPHLDPRKVGLRITRYGWSLEEALELVKRPPRFRSRPHPWKNYFFNKEGRRLILAPKGTLKVYKLINNINSKVYIGITSQDINSRLSGHYTSALNKNENSRLYDAIRKYGKENFSIITIKDDAKDWLELERQEIDLIKKYKSNNSKFGYNITKGGDIGTSKSIMFNNMEFPSFASLSSYYEIKYSKFRNRIRRNWSLEEALELKKRNTKNNPKEVYLNNRKFPNIYSASKFYNKNYKTIITRLSRKWSIEEAFDMKQRRMRKSGSKNEVKIKCLNNNKVYDSLASAGRDLNLYPSNIHKVLNNKIRKTGGMKFIKFSDLY